MSSCVSTAAYAQPRLCVISKCKILSSSQMQIRSVRIREFLRFQLRRMQNNINSVTQQEATRERKNKMLYIKWNRRNNLWSQQLDSEDGTRRRGSTCNNEISKPSSEGSKERQIKTITKKTVIRYMLVTISTMICGLYTALRWVKG